MRPLFSNSLALLTLITSITMVGCSDERAPAPPAEAAINTHHYYVNNRTIYAFNAENGLSTEFSTYDAGENKLISLDTDRAKHGYEFLIYTRDQSIYLKSYEKDGKVPQRLITTANHVCGLYPRRAAVDEGVAGFDNRLVSQDLYIVDVVTNSDENCDPITSHYYEVDFSYLKPLQPEETRDFINNVLRWRETSSAFVLGTMLRNFSPTVRNDVDTGAVVRWGYIGYDVLNQNVQFHNQNMKLVWEAPIDSNGSIPKFFQASRDLALIQSDQDLYVRNIPRLFVLGQDRSSTGSGELPTGSAIASLFDIADTTTLSADGDHPVSVTGDEVNFVVKDGLSLRFYNAEDNLGFINNPVYEADVAITDFSVFRSTPPQIIINTTDEYGNKTLEVVNALNPQAVSSIASGSDIQFSIVDDVLYINTFEEDGANSWQAHRVTNPLTNALNKTTYDNSMFLFAKDQRTEEIYTLMLQSDDSDSNGALIRPTIAPFNPGLTSGFSTHSVFGTIEDEEGVLDSNLNDQSNFILNNIYGGFFIRSGDDVAHLYYFNLNAAKDSLKTIF